MAKPRRTAAKRLRRGAYATQLRLLNARIIAAANDVAGTQAVRTIRVLPVGQTTVPQPRPAASTSPAGAAPRVPVRTRDMAPEGFHRALAAHQTVPRTREMALDTAAAAARQARVLRELSQWAFPDQEEPADEPAPIDSTVLQRRREFAATETAALHRARAERAQRSGAAVILPQQPAPLRSTA
ncbi:hypothetical protein [Streptomyces sp. NBC_01565]|uniref:hypothetical protein n=1 Tax=Streptomyces sp. NBC_01565 TaxID=2975881 RepID=UPI00225AC476|nr:hypothetical protein [Streptomyces sp. NBC_01565]MCX4547182.1 hypothetical protein [Streptomyces sp. NBC_01565]